MDQRCDAEKVQRVVSEVTMHFQKLQAVIDERFKRIEVLSFRMDELSGESMNARSQLDGIERRMGIEGQQQEATRQNLRVSLDQCQEDFQALSRSSTVCQVDIQSWDARHFELEETIFHFRVDPPAGSSHG